MLEKKLNHLTLKVEILEKELKKEHIDKIKNDYENIEKLVREKDVMIQELVQKMEIMEQNINKKSESNHEKSSVEKKAALTCKLCPFEAKSVSGLKVHTKRKHTSKEIDLYPTKCDICENNVGNKLTMKRHMKNHSYISAKYKCLDCDYFSSTDTDMEAHIGKEHSEGFECCLCGNIEESSEKLETHLLTCEVFDCCECDERRQTLSSIKEHMVEKHHNYLGLTELSSLKVSTENYTDIKKKRYCYKDVENILCKIYRKGFQISI